MINTSPFATTAATNPKKSAPLTAFSLAAMALSLMLYNTSTHADNMYIYKDAKGQVLLTNVTPSGNFDKFTQKVKVTYYPSSKIQSGAGNYGQSTASSSRNRNAYDHLIRASASRHGVDPALMKAMMHTESAFNPNARSPVGAQGLMQLMPATARRFSVNNPWNPEENIEGSAKYIAWLMRRYNNNVQFAVAGYNAGEGNVDKYGGIPPFRETQNYVKNVLSRYHSLYKHDSNLMAANVSSASSYDNASNQGGYINGSYVSTGSGSGYIQPVSYGTSSNSAAGNSASYAASAYAALR